MKDNIEELLATFKAKFKNTEAYEFIMSGLTVYTKDKEVYEYIMGIASTVYASGAIDAVIDLSEAIYNAPEDAIKVLMAKLGETREQH